MADYTAFRITLLNQSYPVTYDNFVTELQARAQEQENAREGRATLVANIQRKVDAVSGLTANLVLNGYRVTGGITPITADELATKGYADSLAFSSALPSISQDTYGLSVTNNGVSAFWGHSAAEASYVLSSWFGF